MNYGTYINNKIKNGINYFQKYYYYIIFQVFGKGNVSFFFFLIQFGSVGVFCTINCYFEHDIRILCLQLYIWSWKKCVCLRFFDKKSQKCEQISYEIFGGILLVLNGPLTSLKHPLEFLFLEKHRIIFGVLEAPKIDHLKKKIEKRRFKKRLWKNIIVWSVFDAKMMTWNSKKVVFALYVLQITRFRRSGKLIEKVMPKVIQNCFKI